VKKFIKLFSLIGLIALMITSCDKKGTTSDAHDHEGHELGESVADLKIAYVVTDSVISKFDLFKQKSEEISQKGKKFEGELSSRAKGFEQEVANFQQTAQTMTPNQARAKEEELMKKERNLVTFRDNLMQELSKDESDLYSDVYEKVQEYLLEYAEENKIDMIFSNTRGGAVWYGKASLDITQTVIEGLNKKFASGASKDENKPDATAKGKK
jgi:outer membrane protein